MVLDPAAKSLVEALESDPFYGAVASSPDADGHERRQRLAQYFSYSLQEAKVLGRTVYLEDKTLGASAWLLPADDRSEREAASRKHDFLGECLGLHGLRTYKSIVAWMAGQSAPLVTGAWYLSIIGIAPHAQGQGLGQRLVTPTLAEADAAGVQCYLETFNTRNLRFYERLGFGTKQIFREPITRSEYALMTRPRHQRALDLTDLS